MKALAMALGLLSLGFFFILDSSPAPTLEGAVSLTRMAPPGGMVRPARTEPVEASEAPQMVSKARPAPFFTTPQKEERFVALFPRTTSSAANALRDTLQFYDDEDLPPYYQVWDKGQNQSGLVSVFGGQQTANREFPWAGPAGTMGGTNFRSYRGINFPGPILWWRSVDANGRFLGFDWEFHDDTVLGEVITVVDSNNNDHHAELRTRRANGSMLNPTVNSYVPFPTEESYDRALLARGFTYQHDPGRILSIDSRLPPTNHQRNAFVATALFPNLPSVPESTVADMLDHEIFTSRKGKSWREDGPVSAAMPTASDFNIVPNQFLGAMLPVSTTACMRCHNEAGKIVNLKGETRWRLRGANGIFSFYIYDPEALRNGQLRLNPKLVEAGLLVHKDGMP